MLILIQLGRSIAAKVSRILASHVQFRQLGRSSNRENETQKS